MAQMNLSIEKKQTHGHVEQTCGCQGGGTGCGMEWEFGFSRCKLLHWEWISNEILLYSTGNYIQSFRKIMCVCVCVCVCMSSRSLCYTAKIERTL